MTSQSLIQFEKVSVGYSRRQPVLTGLSFSIYQGEFLGLIGPNGSGKSTVLKTLLGLLAPLAGSVRAPNGNLHFGYVQQRQFVDDIFPLTVRDVVMMGRYGILGPLRRPRRADWEKVNQVLQTTGLSDLARKSYRELSGGQKQRTLIARALASDPTFLVLDEPTNDLDIEGEQQVMTLLQRLHREEKKTILVVSHLLNVVLNFAEKIAFTIGGELQFQNIDEVITEENLSKLYRIPMKIDRINGKKVVLANGTSR